MMLVWLLVAAAAVARGDADSTPYHVEPDLSASLAALHTPRDASELRPSGSEDPNGITLDLDGYPPDARPKRQFSLWGDKRPRFEWLWKRTSKVNLPKRVRFSPWGGKRSGPPAIRDEENKAIADSFDVFDTLREVGAKRKVKFSAWGGKRSDLEDEEFYNDDEEVGRMIEPKRKVKFSAWGGKRGDRFHDYLDNDVLDDEDERLGWTKPKRKVKFSAWGGKRSGQFLDYAQIDELNDKDEALGFTEPKRKQKFSAWGGKRNVIDSPESLHEREMHNMPNSRHCEKGHPSDSLSGIEWKRLFSARFGKSAQLGIPAIEGREKMTNVLPQNREPEEKA